MKITRKEKNGFIITTKWMTLTDYKQSAHYNDWHPTLLDNEELIAVLKGILEKKFIAEYGVDGVKPVVDYEPIEPLHDNDDDFFNDL